MHSINDLLYVVHNLFNSMKPNWDIGIDIDNRKIVNCYIDLDRKRWKNICAQIWLQNSLKPLANWNVHRKFQSDVFKIVGVVYLNDEQTKLSIVMYTLVQKDRDSQIWLYLQ